MNPEKQRIAMEKNAWLFFLIFWLLLGFYFGIAAISGSITSAIMTFYCGWMAKDAMCLRGEK